MINVRNKGAAGEREAANLWKSEGYNARRGTRQSQDAAGEPDVVLEDHPDIWLEIKRGSQTKPFAALEQASLVCKNRMPIAMVRNDGGKWQISMYLYDYCRLLHLPETLILTLGPPLAILSMSFKEFIMEFKNVRKPKLTVERVANIAGRFNSEYTNSLIGTETKEDSPNSPTDK
jgi:hypothetical protein